ncbi:MULTISPECIES: hypothetical protein [unclassified Methanoregula]|uniref:hypothetical protein n=1 Tax=unclassified Methanoregula TaxID=2649730 RepID=UPI0009D24036|nr:MULTISPECIES: hypothetical protein [unclassified Methanoregula]OPX62703.1 MAG: hypothetical protein A4E33_02154 [Methanoregula sp. PtaB.Bin085]OPY35897.1 MAG: hypothetical protein A4E34_00576 [Methanoregula sp. PtaU1.Bin006]
MKIQELIGTILAGSTRLGTFTLSEMLRLTQSKSTNGIAVSRYNDREFDLAILDGEPEGAILIEEKGTLYGDKAVMLLTGTEKFDLYEVKQDLVEAVVMGCRILEKGHIRKSGMDMIPEIGRKSDGLGVLSVAVQRNGEPQNGVRVSIRKEGQMITNDITTENGTVDFKLLYGKYDCIVQDRAMMISTFHIIFDIAHSRITLEI